MQPLGYKPSVLAIELTSSKAVAGKELSLSSWCIASLYIYHCSAVVDFSSEKHSGSTGHRNSWYQQRNFVINKNNQGWKGYAGTHVLMFVPRLSLMKPGQTWVCPQPCFFLMKMKMTQLLPSNRLFSLLAQWLEHSVYNRGIASSSLTIGILTEISLLVPGVPASSRTIVLLG